MKRIIQVEEAGDSLDNIALPARPIEPAGKAERRIVVEHVEQETTRKTEVKVTEMQEPEPEVVRVIPQTAQSVQRHVEVIVADEPPTAEPAVKKIPVQIVEEPGLPAEFEAEATPAIDDSKHFIDVIEETEEVQEVAGDEITESGSENLVANFMVETPDIETQEVPIEQLIELYSAETIETYHELLNAVVATESAETVVDAAETVSFENLLTERTPQDEQLTIEILCERAPEQTLVETLIQLTGVLAENPETITDTDISRAFLEIESALADCYIHDVSESPELRITPELTDKLLSLLRTLGYEHPGDILVSLVDRHGLAFLLQALHYMCQLNNQDNRQEFLAAATRPVAPDSSLRDRTGRLLFSVIALSAPEPILSTIPA